MKHRLILVVDLAAVPFSPLGAAEFFVSPAGHDADPGGTQILE